MARALLQVGTKTKSEQTSSQQQVESTPEDGAWNHPLGRGETNTPKIWNDDWRLTRIFAQMWPNKTTSHNVA
jgi:hypothetical protein